jgi:hypothetical protein
VSEFLRNEIKLAFRLDHGASSFAEELKLLVVTSEMQVHARTCLQKALFERLAVAELNRRFEGMVSLPFLISEGYPFVTTI